MSGLFSYNPLTMGVYPDPLGMGITVLTGDSPGLLGYLGTSEIGATESGDSQNSWQAQAFVNSSSRWVAGAGEHITSLEFYGSGAEGASVFVGIYLFEGGVPTTLVQQNEVVVGVTPDWYSTAVDIALVEGSEYVIACDYYNDSVPVHVFYDNGTSYTLARNHYSDLTNPWSDDDMNAADMVSFRAAVYSA